MIALQFRERIGLCKKKKTFTHGTRQEVALKIYFRMYAYIVYQICGIRKIVPISDIKNYNPRNTRDFIPSVTVKALWRGIGDHIAVEDALRYNARVLRLGGMYTAFI